MMLQEIYFDGNLMDINEDTKITLDIKTNVFTEVSKCVGNRTYTIQLPKTSHNLNVIKQAHLPQSNSTIPYSYHTARYVRNGIEIFSDGYAYIVSVSETIEVCIVWGYPALLRSIFSEGIKLNEITDDGKYAPYVRYNNVTLWSDRTTMRENNGYCYAAIDMLHYQKLTQNNVYDNQYAVTRLPKMGYLRPSIFLSHILSRLSNAYGIVFRLTDVDLYNWLNTIIFPCTTDYANSDQPSLIFQSGGISWSVYQLSTIVYPDDGTLHQAYAHPVGTPACDVVVDVSYQAIFQKQCSENDLRNYINNGLIGARVWSDDYSEYKPASLITVTDSNNNTWNPDSGTNVTDTWTISVSDSQFTEISCTAGGEIHIRFFFNNDYWDNQATMLSGLVIYKTKAKSTLYGMNFELTPNFPDVRAVDFLQWVAAITGTFPIQNKNPNYTSLIEFVPYTTLFNVANAVDWSGKLVRAYNDGASKEIGYTASGWAQNNKYIYGNDDEVGIGTFADGSFNINNVQLEYESEIVGSIFDATKPNNNIPIYSVNEEDDADRLRAYLFPEDDEGNEPLEGENIDPRVMVVEMMPITGNGVYIKGTFDTSLHWKNILKTSRYTQFIKTLQNIKILHEVFALTDLDIKTFDETKPVYLAQYGHYYAVTEIKTSETGTAEVTLFQLEL